MSTTPAVKLRESVVLLVVRAMVRLTFLIYALIGTLLIIATIRHESLRDAVPAELWAAAGGGFGYLAATLVNTKHDPTVQDPAPVQVVNQQDQPVPVEAAPDAPIDDEEIAEDQPAPAPRPRRR